MQVGFQADIPALSSIFLIQPDGGLMAGLTHGTLSLRMHDSALGHFSLVCAWSPAWPDAMRNSCRIALCKSFKVSGFFSARWAFQFHGGIKKIHIGHPS